MQHDCKIGTANDCCIYNYCDNPYGAVKNAKEQYLIDTIKIYHKIQSIVEESSISYMDEIENSIMERYYYIVYNLLKTDCNKLELRLMLNELNADLNKMTKLDKKKTGRKDFLLNIKCLHLLNDQ